MDQIELPLDDGGTAALEAYLDSDRAPPARMLISELDGFLTGLAVGPEPILPSEWMPHVWRGEAPRFADDDESRAVLGGLLGRFNAIQRSIAAGFPEPIFWAEGDGGVDPVDWAYGFGAAVALRAKKWERLTRSPRDGLFLLPILVLGGDNGPLGLDPEEEAQIVAGAPKLIPLSILGIAEYWSRHRPRRNGIVLDAMDGVGQLGRPPGRNDPCPCGSGRKHKKCCGAARAAA